VAKLGASAAGTWIVDLWLVSPAGSPSVRPSVMRRSRIRLRDDQREGGDLSRIGANSDRRRAGELEPLPHGVRHRRTSRVG
jgi:hypothetical protein